MAYKGLDSGWFPVVLGKYDMTENFSIKYDEKSISGATMFLNPIFPDSGSDGAVKP